jgi:hypothetical protein
MVGVRALWDLFREHIVHVAIVAVCPILAYLAMDHGRKGILAAIALLALVIGVYVGVRHPLWLYWGTAVAVGILPFGYFPGVHLPAYLPFALGAVFAALIHPTEQTKYSSMEIAVLVLVAASAVTVVVPGPTLAGLVEFTKWSMATLVTIALLRLSREHLARFGRIFVYAAAANALFGIFIVTLDPLQRSFRYLRIFGYGSTGGDPNKELGRFFYTNGGASQRIRLGAYSSRWRWVSCSSRAGAATPSRQFS